MVITRIERQKKHKRRFSIFSNDEFILGVHEDVLIRSGLRTGDQLDKKRLEELESAEESSLARESALRLLSRRQHSEKELRTKLLEREFDPSVVDSLLSDFRNLDLLNDRRFAAACVHDILMKRPSGTRHIKQQLRLKGVNETIVEEILKEQFGRDSELSLAREAAAKHMRRYRVSGKKIERLKQQKRLADFLARRGFDWETVSSVVKEFFPRME